MGLLVLEMSRYLPKNYDQVKEEKFLKKATSALIFFSHDLKV